MKKLWKLVKKRCLTNRNHENVADFRRAIDTCPHDFTTTATAKLHNLNF